MLPAIESLVDRLKIDLFNAAFQRPLIHQLVHSCTRDTSAQPRQRNGTFSNPSPPRFRCTIERLVSRHARVSPGVHPRPIKLIILCGEIQHGKIEHIVDERRSIVACPLDNTFRTLDDAESTELDVPLVPLVTPHRPKDHQRHGRLSQFGLRCMMNLPSSQQCPVSQSATNRLRCVTFVIAEVPNVTVVQVEDVMPRSLLRSRLPRAGPDEDDGSSMDVRHFNGDRRIDPTLQLHPRCTFQRRHMKEVSEPVDFRFRWVLRCRIPEHFADLDHGPLVFHATTVPQKFLAKTP